MKRTLAIAVVLSTIGCEESPQIERGAETRSIADVAAMASASVVNVSSSRWVSFEASDSRYERDLLFRFFFGVPDEPEQTIEQTRGSAVIVSSDGLALTNHHLVESATQLLITTASGRELKAEIVGVDPETDLALLRLQGDLQGLKPLSFGDSEALRPGDLVIAIGNSFGFGQTVTSGVVSGKGRSDLGILAYEDFIQTDTAINPGNSGGALVNMHGELVGINTALVTKSGAFEGVGLAIPSSLARQVMRSLRDEGRVIRAYLGAAVQNVDDKLVRALHLSSSNGALVSDVVPDSPAAKAGILPKDFITAIDGEAVASARRFRTMISEKLPERPVVIELSRDGSTRRVKAILIERPTRPTPRTIEPARIHLTAGVAGWPLDADSREMLWVPESFATGLVVANIRGGSPASQAGVRPGDVIVSADDAPIESTEALDRIYLESDEPILLRVLRRGTAIYLVLDAGRASKTPKS